MERGCATRRVSGRMEGCLRRRINVFRYLGLLGGGGRTERSFRTEIEVRDPLPSMTCKRFPPCKASTVRGRTKDTRGRTKDPRGRIVVTDVREILTSPGGAPKVEVSGTRRLWTRKLKGVVRQGPPPERRKSKHSLSAMLKSASNYDEGCTMSGWTSPTRGEVWGRSTVDL